MPVSREDYANLRYFEPLLGKGIMKRPLVMIGFAFGLATASGISQVSENIGPTGSDEKTIVTKAPSGRYSLIQNRAHLEACDEQGGWPCYQTTVHFEDKSKPDRVLPEVGVARKAAYQDVADYIISPDEHWFVRDQHLFAGCNILVLYKVEPDGQIRNEQSDLVDLGIKCILTDLHRAKKSWANLAPNDFFHLSGEDVVWNRASDGSHFKMFARPDPPVPSIRDSVVDYDLKRRKMSHGKILLFDHTSGQKIETLSPSH